MTTGVADAIGIELVLARFWESKGKLARALDGYERVVGELPAHRDAHLGRVRLLMALGRFGDAASAARLALRQFPEEAPLHKHLIGALRHRAGNLLAAFAEYDLVRADDRDLAIQQDDLLCCSVVRNEVARLPQWLEHYRRHGVTRFLIVDNESSDGTLEYLQRLDDVAVWRSGLSFKAANFGSAWFEVLLQEYGQGHWCLTVDADELLYFADCEQRTIVDLCRDLDRAGKRAFFALLLDMYSDRPIHQTICDPDARLEDVCPFFDRRFFHQRYERSGPFNNVPMIFGGVRHRVFDAGPDDYLLSKIPLLKYAPDVVLAGGQHWTSYPESAIADETGCLLHFKFLNTFPNYARQEASRQEHALNGLQYIQYSKRLEQNELLGLFDSNESVRFTHSRDLEALGIITRGRDQHRQTTRPHIEFPRIDAVAANLARPFWSVMITVFDRLPFLEQALRSVLDQADDMQIEVIQDAGVPASVREIVADLVERVSLGRAAFYTSPDRLGHPHIFTLAVQRARGQWIHLLHDDDFVEPGFYRSLRDGIEAAPEVGTALCRWRYVDDRGGARAESVLERETAGPIHDWLARIAISCRVQTPAIVVRRQAYETVGGYSAAAGSAFDWEMWQRLAVSFPMWYEPRPLASFREHDGAESHRLIRSGQQVADARRAIDVARQYLPDDAGALQRAALTHYAHYALRLAKQHLVNGDAEAALANIHEGLACSQATSVVSELARILSGSAPGTQDPKVEDR